jgi:hypothetical protein
MDKRTSEFRVTRTTSLDPFWFYPRDGNGVYGEEFWKEAVRTRVAPGFGVYNHRCLPVTAAQFYNVKGWGPILQTLMAGIHDKNSPLYIFHDYGQSLLHYIYHFAFPPWAKHIKLTVPAEYFGRSKNDLSHPLICYNDRQYKPNILLHHPSTSVGPQGFVAFAKCGKVYFPPPMDLNVNMMPIVFGDKSSLPPVLHGYYNLIEELPYMRDDVGKVGYLTVHESFVEAGKSQRRPGIHIESPGVFKKTKPNTTSFTPAEESFHLTEPTLTDWGRGKFYGPDLYEGGIYFASSVDNSTEIWDALVDKNVPGIVHRYGDCEHLRRFLGPGTKLRAGELVWMTDCTPHEALILDEPVYRQFFRVVGPQISHWYANHSTPNPLVPLPEHIIVVRGNKFAPQSLEK